MKFSLTKTSDSYGKGTTIEINTLEELRELAIINDEQLIIYFNEDENLNEIEIYDCYRE